MGEFHSIQVQPEIPGPDAPTKPNSQPQSDSGAAAQRPEWCPEKFWQDGKVNQEALAKSYAELEKGKGKTGEQPPADPKAGQSGQAPADQTQTPQQAIPGVPQETLNKFTSEFQKDGKLSDESYETLKKAGYPKNVVDNYIRGIQAEQKAQAEDIAKVKDLAGGEEGFTKMAQWMQANLSETELAEYNEAVQSGKKSLVETAVKGMHARYTDAVGQDPNLVSGKPSADTGDVFRSTEELKRAMRDPRYKKDEAYRQEVAKKIARSKVL